MEIFLTRHEITLRNTNITVNDRNFFFHGRVFSILATERLQKLGVQLTKGTLLNKFLKIWYVENCFLERIKWFFKLNKSFKLYLTKFTRFFTKLLFLVKESLGLQNYIITWKNTKRRLLGWYFQCFGVKLLVYSRFILLGGSPKFWPRKGKVSSKSGTHKFIFQFMIHV